MTHLKGGKLMEKKTTRILFTIEKTLKLDLEQFVLDQKKKGKKSNTTRVINKLIKEFIESK